MEVRLIDPRTASGVVVLVFGTAERTPRPIGELLTDVESLYWFCLEVADPKLSRKRLRRAARLSRDDPEAVNRYLGLQPRLDGLRLGSPLEVLVQVPAEAWQVGGGLLFTGALAMIFGLPARYQEARRLFWDQRLAADEAKRNWLDAKEAAWQKKSIWMTEMELPEEAVELLLERGEEP
jgi:hypothetical protein